MSDDRVVGRPVNEKLRPVPSEQTFKAVESPMGTSPDDEALKRSLAEAAMRPYLPLLRWSDVDDDGETIALNVSGWTLGAARRNWWLEHNVVRACVLSPRPNLASIEENKRAAEAALRALGVQFRVEGE